MSGGDFAGGDFVGGDFARRRLDQTLVQTSGWLTLPTGKRIRLQYITTNFSHYIVDLMKMFELGREKFMVWLETSQLVLLSILWIWRCSGTM